MSLGRSYVRELVKSTRNTLRWTMWYVHSAIRLTLISFQNSESYYEHIIASDKIECISGINMIGGALCMWLESYFHF